MSTVDRITVIILFCLSLAIGQNVRNLPKSQYDSKGHNHKTRHQHQHGAMNKGVVTGKVVDKETGEPLSGVNVFLEHTTVGEACKTDGTFLIKRAPLGEYSLIASMIGYEMGHQPITIKRGKTIDVTFELRPTLLELGSVVVTGTATPHIYENTPVKTEVVPRKLIEQKFAVNLAEALDMQSGVRVENNCQNCNFTQVRIYGLEGKYSEILVDSDPVMSSLAGVYGLEQIPEEMIEQIEIVKGGGSALYGGGAVAGIVNLITRRPSTNRTKAHYMYKSVLGKPDQRIGAVSEVVGKSNKSGAFIYASTRSRQPFDFNNDGFSEAGNLLGETIGVNWYYKATPSGELEFKFHRIHEDRRGGNMFNLPLHEAQVTEAAESWRWGSNIKWSHRVSPLFDYRIYYSMAHTTRNSFYGGLGDDEGWDSAENKLANLASYGHTVNPLHVAGLRSHYNVRGHLITSGVEYKVDHLIDNSVYNDFYAVDEAFRNLGFYVQDNLRLFQNKALETIVGFRIDKHSVLNDPVFSPRLNLKYNMNSWTLRGAISTGFKAPQVFDEDLHILAIDGEQKIIRNANNLKEEKSVSISGGFDYQDFIKDIPVLFSLSGFYTKLDGAFALEPSPTLDDPYLWTRLNTDGAEVKGIESNFAVRFSSTMELRGGLTYKQNQYDSEYKAVQGVFTTDFMRTPDLYGNLQFTLNLSHDFSVVGGYEYIGPANMPNEEPVSGIAPYVVRTNAFNQFNLAVSYDFHELSSYLAPKISIGIKNITNAFQNDLERGAGRNPAYVYGPAQPRAFFVSLETGI